MRIVFGILTISCLLLGLHALALGDDSDGGPETATETPAPAPAPAATNAAPAGDAEALRRLSLRLEALELRVKYLASREESLTQYVLANEQRAKGLDLLAANVRKLGFENRKIPVDSRIALLKGLEGMAKSLRQDLPKLTKEQANQLKKLRAAKARAAAAGGR